MFVSSFTRIMFSAKLRALAKMPGFRAATPEGMSPGSPFGPNIHALLLYLHHSHHVSFERLSRVMNEPDRVRTHRHLDFGADLSGVVDFRLDIAIWR